MKKIFIAVLVIAVAVFGATAAMAGIADTKHDLSTGNANAATQYVNSGTSEICVFCHAPHSGNTTQTIPLWNRNDTANAGSFTLYTSATLNATVNQPSGASLACFSCHDGSLTLSTDIVNQPNAAPAAAGVDRAGVVADQIATGGALLGTDLTNDHPVSFTYDTALASADGALVDPVDANGSGLGGLVKLFAGQVECASCHNVHDNANIPFLRDTMVASQLCTDCHQK